MSIALVQQASSVAWVSGATLVITFSAAPTNGNALALKFGALSAASGISSISQTGVTWVNAVINSTTRRVEWWYALNISGAGLVATVNLGFTPTAAGQLSAEASEWSGVDTSSALDASTGTNAGTSTTPNSGTTTPTSGREAVVLGACRLGGAYTSGPDSGFSALNNDASRDYGGYLLVASTSGSYTTSFVASSGNWGGAIMTLLAPAAGGPTIGDQNYHGGGRGAGLGMRRGLSYHNQPSISLEERRFLAEERAKKQDFISHVRRVA